MARINRDYAGRIVASLDTQQAQPDGLGYRVRQQRVWRKTRRAMRQNSSTVRSRLFTEQERIR